jgi:hypothetical protein
MMTLDSSLMATAEQTGTITVTNYGVITIRTSQQLHKQIQNYDGNNASAVLPVGGAR